MFLGYKVTHFNILVFTEWGKDKKRTFAAVPNLGLQWVSNYLTCSTNKASVKTEAFVIFGGK